MIISKKFEDLLKQLDDVNTLEEKIIVIDDIHKTYVEDPKRRIAKETKMFVDDMVNNFYFGNMLKGIVFPLTNFIITEKIDVATSLKLNKTQDLINPIKDLLKVNDMLYKTPVDLLYMDLTTLMYNGDYKGINTFIYRNSLYDATYIKDSTTGMSKTEFMYGMQNIFILVLSLYAEAAETIDDVFLVKQIIQWVHYMANIEYVKLFPNRMYMSSIYNFFKTLDCILSLCSRDNSNDEYDKLVKECSIGVIN